MEQYELHRHLDVSLRLSTLLELAQKQGNVSQSTSLEAFRANIVLEKPLSDLQSVLARFEMIQHVFSSPEVLERIAFEAVEDCRTEGTTHVEFRFSPSWVAEKKKLSWNDVLTGFSNGLERALAEYPEMHAGLICIASRDYGAEQVDKTVEFFLNNRARFIGLDLAGNETEFPCRLFQSSFKKAKSQGARITIHAGEASGPENIWEAIELLGAERIGHGISSVQDATLLKELAQKKICLEVCPTSNWITQAVKSLVDHPLPRILAAGVPVCVNTDDPTVFGVPLKHELEIARSLLGLGQDDLKKCNDFAAKATFLNS